MKVVGYYAGQCILIVHIFHWILHVLWCICWLIFLYYTRTIYSFWHKIVIHCICFCCILSFSFATWYYYCCIRIISGIINCNIQSVLKWPCNMVTSYLTTKHNYVITVILRLCHHAFYYYCFNKYKKWYSKCHYSYKTYF